MKPTHVWLACKNCDKERWVRKDKLKKPNYTGLCPACSMSLVRRTYHYGEANWNWKLGRVKLSGGYIGIKLYPNDLYYQMATQDGYVAEHRLVMAKQLGRCLDTWELVHHKNGIRNDNHFENLEILPNRQTHMAFTLLQEENKRLKLKLEHYKALGGTDGTD